MAKKKNDDFAALLLLLAGLLVFLPFLVFSFLRYRKLKKTYNAIPNIQRVYDVGVLYKTIGAAVILVVFAGVFCIGLSSVFHKNGSPEFARIASQSLLIFFPLVLFWPMKKMAERVATEYFGVIFNDNDRTIILPVDIRNMALGEILRLRFISRLGDQERINIAHITNITREKGINFYIHGDFGSRKINFTNKQKRDECISALQARTRVKGGRDYGY